MLRQPTLSDALRAEGFLHLTSMRPGERWLGFDSRQLPGAPSYELPRDLFPTQESARSHEALDYLKTILVAQFREIDPEITYVQNEYKAYGEDYESIPMQGAVSFFIRHGLADK